MIWRQKICRTVWVGSVFARDLRSQSSVSLKEVLRMNPSSTRAHLPLQGCRSQSIQMCYFFPTTKAALVLLRAIIPEQSEKWKSEHMTKQSGDLFVWKQWRELKTIALFVFISQPSSATAWRDSTLGCAVAIPDHLVWPRSEALGWKISFTATDRLNDRVDFTNAPEVLQQTSFVTATTVCVIRGTLLT